MKNIDKQVKDLAEAISNSLGVEVEVFKIDTSKINNDNHSKAFKAMIEDSFETIKNIQNCEMPIEDKIKHIALNFINASKVDKNDMKFLNKKEAKRYINLLKSSSDIFNSIISNIRNDISKFSEESKDIPEEDNLESLSKEELIARLRSMK